MPRFKNALLIHPLDQQMLFQVVRLCGTGRIEMTLLAVAPQLERSRVTLESGQQIDLQELLVKDQQSELNQLAEKLEENGVVVDTAVLVGPPFYEITKQVIANGHDLVAMMAGERTSRKFPFMGTTAMHLMRKCPCPVWVVKPSRRTRVRKVLAAIDPYSASPGCHALNQDILKRAAHIARTERAEFHVVHAWNPLVGRSKSSRRWMSRTEFRLYAEQLAADHRGRLENALHLAGCRHAKVHMLQGDAADVVAGTAARENADLLVMGTVCRTGVPGFFIGNTAEMVLNKVECSVLTVKPADFRSPIDVAQHGNPLKLGEMGQQFG